METSATRSEGSSRKHESQLILCTIISWITTSRSNNSELCKTKNQILIRGRVTHPLIPFKAIRDLVTFEKTSRLHSLWRIPECRSLGCHPLSNHVFDWGPKISTLMSSCSYCLVDRFALVLTPTIWIGRIHSLSVKYCCINSRISAQDNKDTAMVKISLSIIDDTWIRNYLPSEAWKLKAGVAILLLLQTLDDWEFVIRHQNFFARYILDKQAR